METERSMQRLAQICQQVVPDHRRLQRGDGAEADLRMGIEGVPTFGVGQPALEIELAFPQATPASKFPPSALEADFRTVSNWSAWKEISTSQYQLNRLDSPPVWPLSDFYQLNDLLSDEERAIRDRVRIVMEKEVAPVIAKYWEKAEFPFELMPTFAKLNVSGGTIKGYGCPGMSILSSALVTAEIARVDASCSTFMMVHTCLGMLTIGMLASEKQKQRWLPPLARLDHVSCWGLTEPAYGSDASSLNTIASKIDGGWLLNGQKRWIGNATFADILVIFARNMKTNQINGFVVKKGANGLSATKIENKIGLRIVQNGDIILKDVFVPDEDRIAYINSFQDTNKVLAVSRIMVAWQPIGISMGVYDVCHRYLLERKQFGQPLAALQLNQEKLVRMLGHIQAMFLMGWRLCKLYDAGKMTPGHASLAKSWNTKIAREVCALGRELLGGNGILSDFNVAKAFCDLEPIYTYEGTYEVNSLVTGREITGIASIKPPVSSRNKPKSS